MKKNLYTYLMLLTAVACMVSVAPSFSPLAFAGGGYSISSIEYVPKSGTQASGIVDNTQGQVLVVGNQFYLATHCHGFLDFVGSQFVDIDDFMTGFPRVAEIRGICGEPSAFKIVGLKDVQDGFVASTTGPASVEPITYTYGGTQTRVTYPNGCSLDTSGNYQIVGLYTTWTDNYSHGFLFDSSDGSYIGIDYPTGMHTIPYGINSSNQIVGEYQVADQPSHGFLLDITGTWSWTTIDYPGAASTSARGINDAGQIVGTYSDSSGNVHGFLRDPITSKFTKIDVVGGYKTIATGISKTGRIVGNYWIKNDGKYHSFLYAPITVIATG